MSLKTKIKKKFPFLVNFKRSFEDQSALFNAQLSEIYKARQNRHINSFCKYGKRVFCQSDEDGLTLEIIKRLNISNGTFIEFGVGNGTENNTLVLLSMGFRGVWIGGENLVFDLPSDSKKLFYQKKWVTLENINKLYHNAISWINSENPDVFSMDLDGNDAHFLRSLFNKQFKPKLIICEINGIFPLPIKFEVEYNSQHVWERDDYQGASLATINEILESNGYKLIVCNAATGVNAFFVEKENIHLFGEVPSSLEDLYVEPLHINYSGFTFPRSIKTIKKFI